MDYPKVKVCLDTSEDNLIDELYTPCLTWAERFDRGVGYFTTGWLTYNVAGLSDFASRGGKMRLITSPILSTEDTNAIIGAENQDGSAFLRLEAALLENVEILKQEMEADIINAFSWMLYDGIIDMLKELKQSGIKLAVLSNKAQNAVTKLCDIYFDNLLDITFGAREGIAKKPAPDALLECAAIADIALEDIAYIGDSDVDVLTARNAGVDCIAVSWGFRDKGVLIKAGADKIADNIQVLKAELL